MSGTITRVSPSPPVPTYPEGPPARPSTVPPRVSVPLMGADTLDVTARRGDIPLLASAQREIPLLSPDQGEPPRPWFDQRGYAVNRSWFTGETGTVATTGIRLELETTIQEGKLGRVAAVGGMTTSFGNRSFHVNPAVGVRGELGQRDKLAVYSTLTGGANIGALNGEFTNGWQVRTGVGVEHKFLFAEYAFEQATNYRSHGVTAGLRLHF